MTKKYIKFSEILKDIDSAKKFCKLNKIKPTEIIVLWEEKVDF